VTIGKSPRDEPGRVGKADPPAGTSGAPNVARPRSSEHADTPPEPDQPPASAAPGEGGIGAFLASARRSANLTVEQVSAQTRVRVPIVCAIEAEDFTRCGGDFYARGHIRAIARAVGVDGDSLVARYDAAHGGSPAAARPVPISFESERVRPERRGPNWTVAMVAAIVVVVAVIGFNLVSGKHRTTAEVGPTSASPTAAPSRPSAGHTIVPTTPPPASTQPTPSGSAVAAVPADKVTVKLVAESGTSWMSVTGSAGNQIFQGDLADGKSQTFTDDKRINLVLGNAAAVHLFVNGKDLGNPGGDGQVVRLAYTPGNPQAG
jgi:cytoskeletal protein RodZ